MRSEKRKDEEDELRGVPVSGCGGIGLTIMSLARLTQALEDLKFQYRVLEEMNQAAETTFEMKTSEGTVERMNVIVRDPEGLEIGFQRQKNGQFRVFTSATAPAIRRQQESVINRIRQKYTYNTVKQQLAARGYSVVEEKEMGDRTIQLVARRWR